jgi:hypothetical protein
MPRTNSKKAAPPTARSGAAEAASTLDVMPAAAARASACTPAGREIGSSRM